MKKQSQIHTPLKSLMASTALMIGLAVSGPAIAGECLNEACTMQSLSSLEMLGFGQGSQADAADGDTASPHYGSWGFDMAGMDKSVHPGDDFFRYANGTAFDKMVIPADRSSYGSFNALSELAQRRLKTIILDLSAKDNLSGDSLKIATLYRDMMDTKTREALDIAPIYENLAAIRAAKTHKDMAVLMGRAPLDFESSLFGMYITADSKRPTHEALHIFQSGLSLPDRDYYLEEKFADKKLKYEAHLAHMLRQIGYANATETARAVVAFETEIAKVQWTRIESRNRDKTYNAMSWKELAALAPGFDWHAFAKASATQGAQKIIVSQKSAFPAMAKVFAQTPIETLKAWQSLKVVTNAAPYLSKRFSDANWAFYSKELSGAEAQSPLWKQAVGVAEGTLGESLGREYVERYFPAESKAAMVQLVENLRVALKARIDGLEWMSDTTKQKAQRKLSAIGVKVGYPDKWRDYSGLEIKSGELVSNMRRSTAFEWADSLSKLDKPVQKHEWGMTPQTVNAYYSPARNEIVFPAAILQAPFFDPKADDAINYGGIGGVIGHEFTHGFDDQGRKTDFDGSLNEWWTPEDEKKFEVQAAKLGAQYDSYEALPGVFLQGKLGMGENIADKGGVLVGLDAYRLSLSGKEAPVLDGFSGDQRVFLGWAQVWRTKMRDEALRRQVVTGPHSPATFRVIGPVRNVNAWYDAFGVGPEHKNYIKPEDRVRIW
jgi:putative endopeptidase